MGKIFVQYRGAMADLTGLEQEEVNAERVQEVVRHIRRAHGSEAARLSKTLLITVNQTSILLLQGWRTPLWAGDVVSFLPICGGG
ncbi:MAG: hypothetical protein HFE97_07420 [Oscillospiraceae bacterium]|nr:hypothetical protein [Oscillospiraceae bacterium]